MDARHLDRALRSASKAGLVRPRDLTARGLDRRAVYRLVADGRLERIERGLYAVVGSVPTGDRTLAEVAARAPTCVFCLLTALRLHELTTQMPREVWIALPGKARIPRIAHVRLRVARFSPEGLSSDVESIRVEGVAAHVTSAARTVVDCFKYRNKIGLDVALEALREFLRRNRGGADQLARLAKHHRVARVMQPYFEALA
jgi:predicted transcriptional regulator of viral defense system